MLSDFLVRRDNSVLLKVNMCLFDRLCWIESILTFSPSVAC